MLRTIKGNILDRPEGINTCLQQCNSECRMGAGVALALKKKWPEVEAADKKYYSERLKHCFSNEYATSISLLGEFSRADNIKGESPEFAVYNLYGQRLSPSTAGCNTDYNAVVKAFPRVVEDILKRQEELNFKAIVGIPKRIGCALGGGKVSIYEAIIEESFKNSGVEVILVDFDG